MFLKCGFILLTCLTLATAGYYPKEDWFFNVDGKQKGSNPMVADEIPPDESDDSLWSQVAVVKMHYDCGGRLIRQEVAKVKTRAGVNKLSSSKTSWNSYSEGGTARDPKVEAPAIFKSMKERVRFPRPTTTPQGPAATEQSTIRPKIEFEPDRIIDVPIRSCPEGQNEDFFGDCRPEFREMKP